MSETVTDLKGALSTFPLTEVIQLLHETRKTGILCLERADGQGEIYFSEGEARYARVGRSRGQRAFHALVKWVEGDFTFIPGKVRRRRTIKRQTMGLLIEATRLLDEQRQRKAA